MLQEPDSINKKTIIIHGNDKSSFNLELAETLRNVVAVKHIRTYATIQTPTTDRFDFKPVFIKINEFNLKDVHIDDGMIMPIFTHLIFEPSSSSATYSSAKSGSTGIISDFRADVDNFVCNPLIPSLNKLNIDFISKDGTPTILKEFMIELCIYSTHAKLTMN